MKINRHGRAKVLTQSEIQLIFSDGLDNDHDACGGLLSVALCSACACSALQESAKPVPC